jgi:hypothetical protein
LVKESKFSKSRSFFLIAFIVFLLFPNAFNSFVTTGIDGSNNLGINLAWKYHLIFGKDFVFAFGPLGFLNYRLPVAIQGWVYLLADIYSIATLIHVLYSVLYPRLRLLPVVFLLLALLPQIYGTMFDRYFLFFLFYLFSFIKKPGKAIYLWQAGALTLLSFYFKVYFGVMAIALFTATFIYMLVIKKISLRRGAFILAAWTLALLLSAWLLHVNLKGYVSGSFHIIGSYQDAMYLKGQSGPVSPYPAALVLLFLMAALVLYLLILSVYKKDLAGRRDEIFIFMLLAIVAFSYYKGAFIRQDGGQCINFFKIISLFAGLSYLFSPVGERRLVGATGWFILYLSYYSFQVFSGGPGRVVSPSVLADKVRGIGKYFSQLAAYREDQGPAEAANSELKKIIGDHTADVIPWEISKIYFNGLRYDPRPVIQSFYAYDGYLDSLNQAKYLSPDAPDYILFSMNSIDNRYPLFDESKTKLAIFSHYAVVKEIDGDLLLRKKKREDLTASAAVTTSAKIGEDILLGDRPELAYSRIKLRYSLRGRIRSLLYMPPPLRITLTLQDGETMSYRAIPSMLEDGAIVNRYIRRLPDFQLLMQSAGLLYTPVSKIRLDVDSANAGFAESVELTTVYYAFPPRTGPEDIGDSLKIPVLTRQYKPSLLDNAAFKEKEFPWSIDEDESYSPIIRIRGWAYLPGVPHKDIRETVVLRAGGKVFELPSEMEYRADVATYHPNKDSSAGAGFTAWAGKSQLPAGKYQVGISVTDTVRKEQWVCYTAHFVVIP